MPKNLTIITLGTILREIQQEGQSKGLNWAVPRLYVTRNEATPQNVEAKLEKLKQVNRNATLADAERRFLFPFYRNQSGHWRVYSREEAEDLKDKIKKSRRYVE